MLQLFRTDYNTAYLDPDDGYCVPAEQWRVRS